jgi:hypothetical protein
MSGGQESKEDPNVQVPIFGAGYDEESSLESLLRERLLSAMSELDSARNENFFDDGASMRDRTTIDLHPNTGNTLEPAGTSGLLSPSSDPVQPSATRPPAVFIDLTSSDDEEEVSKPAAVKTNSRQITI